MVECIALDCYIYSMLYLLKKVVIDLISFRLLSQPAFLAQVLWGVTNHVPFFAAIVQLSG